MMSFFLIFSFLVFVFFYFDLLYIFSLFYLSMFIGMIFGISFLGFTSIGVGSFFFLDCLSFYLILLTFWVFAMVFFLFNYDGYTFFLLFSLFFFLVVGFIVPNIFWFYIFFECSMIPIFFIILGLGSGEDRLFSGFYMFVYTMFSSLPCLFVMLLFLLDWGFVSFGYFNYGFWSFVSFYYFFFVFVFMVKVPIFIFHIWLPKAHVDAPVYGSMILASVMLKLGSYGIFRLLYMLDFSVFIVDFFFSLCLVGLFFVPFFCFFSSDFKVVIAYSSVVHMCLMVCGIFSGYFLGYVGGFYMMLSHGMCSSGLFMMINMIYCRSGSRLFFFNKGFFGIFPIFSFLWLFMIMDNIGAPPSLSIFSEIFCLSGSISSFFVSWVFIFFSLFLMSCISMNLFFYSFGAWSFGCSVPILIMEYFLIFFHLFPLNFFSFFCGVLF